MDTGHEVSPSQEVDVSPRRPASKRDLPVSEMTLEETDEKRQRVGTISEIADVSSEPMDVDTPMGEPMDVDTPMGEPMDVDTPVDITGSSVAVQPNQETGLSDDADATG